MNMVITDSYEEMSRQAAEELLRVIQSMEQPLICPASGSSPEGMYRQFVQLVENNQINTSNWFFVALDEWRGMNENDEGSCRFYLDQQLFRPLGTRDENICFFNGRAADLEAECQKAEEFIAAHGGIDVAIVGLGMNGHIGMNEPGTPAALRTHIADIHPVTKQVGQKYFSEPKELDAGLTLGLANLLEASNLFLLVNGAHKAGIVSRMIHEEVSDQLPATILRNHPGLRIYLDREAAQYLK
jgi:galactosamine-6-phosphate isomerase